MPATDAPGLLFAATDADPNHEEEFNRWYDERHVPQRLALPGVTSARRFQVVEGAPKYVALYELDSPKAMQSEAYRALSYPPILNDEDRVNLKRFANLHRAVMVQIASAGSATPPPAGEVGGVLVVAIEPNAGYEEEFNAWYNEEHIVYGAKVPGVLRVRRFEALEGDPHYVALWELRDPDVPKSPAFREAVETPWTHRIRQHYTRKFRGVYRPR